MLFCTFCGEEIPNGYTVCPACGNNVPQYVLDDNNQSKVEDVTGTASSKKETEEMAQVAHAEIIPTKDIKKPKRKKGKIIALLVLIGICALVLVLVALYWKWYFSAEQKTIRALRAGDYDAVMEIMRENLSVDSSEEVINRLNERLEQIKTDFSNGSIEYSAAIMELDSVMQLKIKSLTKKAEETKNFIEAVNLSRTNFATAESYFSTKDYPEAISYYRMVIIDDSNYAAALEKLTEATGLYRTELLATAKEYADAGLYSEAIDVLEEGLTNIPNDTKLTEQIRVYEKEGTEKLQEEALTAAAAFAEEEDYLNAYKTIAAVMDSQTPNAAITNAYNTYKSKYISQVIEEAEELLAKNKFDESVAVLSDALKVIPDNEQIQSKIQEINAQKPISITTLLAVNSNWTDWNVGSPTDPFGNDYSEACNYVIIGSRSRWFKESYVEYRLYGDYKTISGQLSTHIDSAEGTVSRMQIYGDDVLLYTSKDMGRKTDMVCFSVDVTGVEYVKIVIYTDPYNSAVILSDIMLWPEE